MNLYTGYRSLLQAKNSTASFTLVELLIVVGVLAVLAAVVVVALNPAQLLAQARDARRQQDVSSLNYTLQAIATNGLRSSFGTSSVVYISLPDEYPTCDSYSTFLPELPSGWSYNCVSTSTLQNIDGTGWVPVDFKSNGTAPFSSLPIDPINEVTNGYYYTYVPGGSFALTAKMESQKYQKTSIADGGGDPLRYEAGSNLALSSFVGGMVAHWDFASSSLGDDGMMYFDDTSGLGQIGGWDPTGGGVEITSSPACMSGSCLYADSASAWTAITSTAANPEDVADDFLSWSGSRSVSMWIKLPNISNPITFFGDNGFSLSFDGVSSFNVHVSTTYCGFQQLNLLTPQTRNPMDNVPPSGLMSVGGKIGGWLFSLLSPAKTNAWGIKPPPPTCYHYGYDASGTPRELSPNSWIHIVGVRDVVRDVDSNSGTISLSLYVNGSLLAQSTYNVNVQNLNVGDPSIGDVNADGTGVYIGDTVIYNRALSASEVQTLYDGSR